MVFVVVAMSFSGLHSVINIRVCGITVAGMNLESLGCMGVICIFTKSL